MFKIGIEGVSHVYGSLITYHSDYMIWSITLAMHYLMQCFGTLLVAPILQRFKIQSVLSLCVFLFGSMVVAIPIMGIGNTIDQGDDENIVKIPKSMIQCLVFACLFSLIGFFHGVIELIRRLMPPKLVSNDESLLKRLDSMVHVFYEIAGTAGPVAMFFLKEFLTIEQLLIPSAVGCFLACIFWKNVKADMEKTVTHNNNLWNEIVHTFKEFIHSVANGFKLVMGNRWLIWLIPAYSIPLVVHRYFEGTVLLNVAETNFNCKDYKLLFVAFSNFGELMGSLFVYFFTNLIKTPLPWIRWDAICLFFAWIIYQIEKLPPVTKKCTQWFHPSVLLVCALCSLISFGWASGDVSLVAYIQSKVSDTSSRNGASPLGSVMAFLYACFIVIFTAITVPLTTVSKSSKDNKAMLDQVILFNSCVAFSVMAVVIFLATFIPKNSFSFNPSFIESEGMVDDDSELKPQKQNVQN